ncbi:TIGR00341 family protein [Halobacteriales archaeon QS_4_69_31]|nr:MAG: TIGR00341 family protein [Halobacteriales archaeon QS_4_69_31]
MRLVQVTVPSGKLETVRAALDDEGVDFVITEETSDRQYAAIAYIPLPTNAVEPVLERLREAGVDESTYTVILDAQTVVSRDFEKIEERYAEAEDTDRIAQAELVATALDLVPPLRAYLVMTVVSAVIATAGLLLDSPAVVVGSMVIAPLIGPAMTASVGTVVVDEEMFTRGVKLQVVGLLLSVASAAVFAWFVRTVNLVPPITDVTAIPEVRERLAPDFLSLVVAIGAGVAGSLSMTTGVSSALVGVMIAVALIPPAATVGIGIAWGRPMVSLGSGVLVLVNLLSINLAALVVLRYSGYRPTQWFRLNEARGATVRRVAVLVVAIVVLSGFLGGVTYDSFQSAQTEDRIRAAAADTLAATAEARLLDVEVRRSNDVLFRTTESVVVTVGTDGGTAPSLAGPLDAAIENATGHPVDTEVRYVQVERA